MLQILFTVIIANQLVNFIFALAIILVIGGIAFYGLTRTNWSADTKGYWYAGISLVLIALFLYLIGVIS